MPPAAWDARARGVVERVITVQGFGRAGEARTLDLSFVPEALWLFLPAYVANMAPVFAMKLFPRWNARMDAGRTWRDGRPLLGAGKTWRGLAAGAALACTAAIGQSFLRRSDLSWTDFAFERTGGFLGPIVLGLALGAGAIVGDAAKSFLKRRTGREGGAPWFPFDQLDFVVGGLAFAYVASLLLQALPGIEGNWWWDELGGAHWPRLAVIVLLTPLLHLVVNVIGYYLKLKKVPW